MAEETARDQSPFRRPGQRNPPVVPPRPELVGRLSVTSMNFAIPTNQDAQMHVHEEHGKESWRYRVLVFLHSTKVQFTLMSLLVLDVVILCTELFLLASFPNCSTITRDAISCCPVLDAMDHSARFLAEDTGGHSEEFCEDGSEASLDYEAGCDVHKYEGVHLTEEILFALTITILAIFFIELNVRREKRTSSASDKQGTRGRTISIANGSSLSFSYALFSRSLSRFSPCLSLTFLISS